MIKQTTYLKTSKASTQYMTCKRLRAMAITRLKLTGKPFDRGVQHGRAVKGIISTHVNPFVDKLLSQGTPKELEDFSSRYEDLISKRFPHLIEETRGLAEGLGVPVRRALLFQLIWEFVSGYLPFQKGHSIATGQTVTPLQECSAIVASGECTADSKPISSQNTDYPNNPLAEVLPIVANVTPTDGYRYVGRANVGYLGTIRLIGFNEAGLSFVSSGVHQKFGAEFGLPPLTVAKEGLERFRTVDQVIDLVKSIPTWGHCGENVECMDAGGTVARIEFSSKQPIITVSSDGYLASTNHYISQELANHGPTREEYPSSFTRYDRITQLMKQWKGKMDLDSTAKKIMTDHEFDHRTENGESCICRHGRTMTIANVTAQPSANRLIISVGNPCEGKYNEFKLHSN